MTDPEGADATYIGLLIVLLEKIIEKKNLMLFCIEPDGFKCFIRFIKILEKHSVEMIGQ